MIKIIIELHRKNGMTRKEFAKYWEKVHAPKVVKAWPNLRRYVQNHPIPLPNNEEPQCDGVAELYFDDLESWVKAYKGDAGKNIRDDEPNFLDQSKLLFVITEERWIKDR
jgi:uncharacterized protein (TIGR02118 family)